MLDPKLIEQIDACRPESRDIEQAELAHLAESLPGDPQVRAAYQTVQRLDARLVAAFDDVPVPAGLAGRILDRLAAEPAPAALAGLPAAATAIEPTAGQQTPVVAGKQVTLHASSADAHARGWPSRRQMLKYGSALAAVLLVGVSIALVRQPAAVEPAVTEEALAWYLHLDDAWQPMTRAPKALAFPAGLGTLPHGWQPVALAVARRGVVYDLGQAPRLKAVLFVLKAIHPGLPSSIPRLPQSTTAGLAIGAWQSGGRTYVLVVEGNKQAYEKLVQPAQQPLA